MAVIDLHCHLLPGVDDGPTTLRETLAMARAAWDTGTRTMVCTPHVNDHYPTRPSEIHAWVAELQSALADVDVPLRVLPGAEIALAALPRLDEEELALGCLGEGRWLLVEMPFRGWPIALAQTIADLEIRGYGVVLAHPERAESIQRAPDRIRDLVGRGALVQVNGASITGDNGPVAQRTALSLLAGGAAHLIASDAHSAGPWRPPGLEDALAVAAEALDVHPQTLRWSVEDGPAAVVEGRPVRPPRLVPGRVRLRG